MPVDHPSLDPIWQEAAEHDLAIVHHSFTWSPPYFPAYDRDVGQRLPGAAVLAPLGRDAVHGRVPRRRHPRPPSRRCGSCVLECGFGWLPFWVRRMDEQVSYVGRTAKLKMLPSEHLTSGRVFCNVERTSTSRCSRWSPRRSATTA